jgi:hypothetical protein
MCTDAPPLEGQNSTSNPASSKSEEILSEIATDPVSLSENSSASYDDNNDIIEFGPIKVKPRKKPAPTLATGRRSKYEVLSPQEEQKRDIRRARNRAAAERVRLSRLNVEQQLQGQINVLEEQEQKLLNKVQMLHHQKLHLETRLFTHDKICPTPTMTGLNPQNDLMSAFTTCNPSTSTTFLQLEQVSEINLDELFLNSPPTLQNQQDNYSDSLTTMIPDDDPEDFLMNL